MSTLWLPPPQVLLPGHDFASRPNTLPPFSTPSSELTLASFSVPATLPPFATSPSSSEAAAASRSPFDGVPAYDRESLKLPALMPGRPGGKRIFMCPHSGCGQTFTVNGNLKKHIAAKHELRKDFKCTHKGCGRSFAKKFNMMRHLNVHRTRGDKRSGSGAARAQLMAMPMIARARADSWSSDELVIASFMADHCADSSPSSSPTTSHLMV